MQPGDRADEGDQHAAAMLYQGRTAWIQRGDAEETQGECFPNAGLFTLKNVKVKKSGILQRTLLGLIAKPE